MRALCLGALAVVSTLALAGCSHQVTPQVASPCVDLSGRPCVDGPVADQSPQSLEPADTIHKPAAAVARRATLQHKHARAAKRRVKSPIATAKTIEKAIDKPIEKPLAAPARTPRPDPVAPADGAPAPVIKTPSVTTDMPNPAKVQSDVMVAAVTVAAELAERMTALRVPEGPADSHLVAVLLARPTVRGLGDLSGKVIAIDERYAKSNAKITAAMNAAGATEVLLLEGQATAITRLNNGEVSAAVVALVSPEAAEAFPKVAGFRLFSVVLKP
ncbi:hypothetical protein ACQR13_31725 [Bradyrhizobium sp. HKCCYLRH3059]|uniref:hypothetical protein n=1 Tax=unclassified Bradyrhizobium TaxID=2631580 RepID=UPI002916FD38|nr:MULTISPECIES: hypothetical protein [unclassified Bradyrhizobium]